MTRGTMEKPFQYSLYPAPLFGDNVRHSFFLFFFFFFFFSGNYTCLWNFQRVSTSNFPSHSQVPVPGVELVLAKSNCLHF